jgi:ethanolamine ammonia-lyase large subunit
MKNKTAIDGINELGNERDALVVVLTKIMNVVDRVNPAGRTCSIADMTNALLEIREAAFQAVAVPLENTGNEKKKVPSISREHCHLANGCDLSADKDGDRCICVCPGCTIARLSRFVPFKFP